MKYQSHRRLSPFIVLLPILLFTLCWLVVHNNHGNHSPQVTTTNPHHSVPRSGAETSSLTQDDELRSLISNKVQKEARALAGAGKPLAPDFLEQIVRENRVRFTLPDSATVEGEILLRDSDENGLIYVHARIQQPAPGTLFIQRQTTAGVLGPFVGDIVFDDRKEGWRIEPTEDLASARFVPRPIDDIMCIGLPFVPEIAQAEAEQTDDMQFAPQTHPADIPIPYYQTVIPLQSLPGAVGVIYLDFDGEEGPIPSWGTFDAEPSGASNTQIFEIWQRVSEDFQGFNLNITTDRKVFDLAPLGQRQQVIITPYNKFNSGAAGVAKSGTFNYSPSTPCWSFYVIGKFAAEVISHEIGHTLRLNHDGRTDPLSSYYGGHGVDPVGWAPIMGVGYYKNLTQWSKGEYLNANRSTEDDLETIITKNNGVAYRDDDYGADLATAGYLEILPNNNVSNEGIIERTGDIDAFRFRTSGGSVTLAINPVAKGPNLDLHVELVNAQTLSVITQNNPVNNINALFASTLAAGEYLLRVRGTGRGDPLGDGYTDYGSLGAYLITGIVNGGVKPERFSIAENRVNGTRVGTITPRNKHSGAPLTFSISSGNKDEAFSINPATGALAVANSTALNFEALSSRWDAPAVITLFVTITNPNKPALNETLRVVVQVTDVNEAPTINLSAFYLPERTSPGTYLTTAIGDDPDRFQLVTYHIINGNADGAFQIDENTGIITVATPIEVAQTHTRQLTVAIADNHNPPLTTTATVAVTVVAHNSPNPSGGIIRTVYENITGNKVTSLTSSPRFPDSPDREIFLKSFDDDSQGNYYGSTILGYLIVPATGDYRFHIASDDHSTLDFAANGNPASLSSIASVYGTTDRYEWTKYSSQDSGPIPLKQGQICYIEVRHKESTGNDHVAVAWTGPLNSTPEVIPGRFLVPVYRNYPPKIPAATFQIRENAIPGQTLGIAKPSDANYTETFTNFEILGGTGQSFFAIDSPTGRIVLTAPLNIALSPLTLNLGVTDGGTPPLTGSGSITIEIIPSDVIASTDIIQQIWSNINGSTIPDLTNQSTYPFSPSTTRLLTTGFDSGSNYADNFGSRIRALVTPPTTGTYNFYITSDDSGQLIMSDGSTPTGAATIAQVNGSAGMNQWTKYLSQTSPPRQLIAGQSYYIEALHKEDKGGDHVRVAWTGPGIDTPTVIPASALKPYDINLPPVFAPANYNFAIDASLPIGSQIGTLTASDPEGESLVFSITGGNEFAHFAIDSAGRLTFASAPSPSHSNFQLTVTAQDKGIGGIYSFQSATATVTITVSNTTNPDFPAPDPMTWASPPAASSATSVTMTATTAVGRGGVEYFFECLTPGGQNSGWQTSATFTNTGLLPGGTYAYRVKVRDKSPQAHETGWSPTVTATLPRRPTVIGGEVAIVDGHMTHTFRQDGNSQFVLQGEGTLIADVLVVAGGGGGGSATAYSSAGAGGGGAGGVVYRKGLIITESTPISIGNGGAAGSGGNVSGSNGGNSSFGTLIALGGGGGAGGNVAGKNGGSGGGGRGFSGGTALQPTSTSQGYGHAGGAWTSSGGHGAGGGGGAGAAAPGPNPATVGGPGGVGLAFDISSVLTHYAGGGGGGGSGTSAFGLGGIGGGGNGGNDNTSPAAGAPNTGGGGGGGNNKKAGAAGGSGIVIIRYPIDEPDDFSSWAAQWPYNDLGDPAADSNGDGMTNGEKYIWGLDPTDASSIQPILILPDPASLSFSYKRRSPALTGRVFSVWTSSDLIEWKRDDAAIQSASPPNAQFVESVTVTLSPTTSRDRVFVRVEAN